MERLRISSVDFAPSSPGERDTGLLGYVSFCLNGGLRIDGVTLRRTGDGRLVLSFPAKPGLTGAQFFYVRPLDSRTRREIERQVFRALKLEDAPR